MHLETETTSRYDRKTLRSVPWRIDTYRGNLFGLLPGHFLQIVKRLQIHPEFRPGTEEEID